MLGTLRRTEYHLALGVRQAMVSKSYASMLTPYDLLPRN